jgi:hypothetical protein
MNTYTKPCIRNFGCLLIIAVHPKVRMLALETSRITCMYVFVHSCLSDRAAGDNNIAGVYFSVL